MSPEATGLQLGVEEGSTPTMSSDGSRLFPRASEVHRQDNLV